MGFRGYISSRPYFESRTPQHVQNLVIRDYCARKQMEYLLSATEYAMPGSYLMLQNVLDDLTETEGIVCYSLFQLPHDNSKRSEVYDVVLNANKQIHFSLESLSITRAEEIDRIENIWKVGKMLRDTLSVSDLKNILTT